MKKKFSIVVDRCYAFRVEVEADNLYDALEKAGELAPYPGNCTDADWSEEKLDVADPEFERLRKDPGFINFVGERFDAKKEQMDGLVDIRGMADICFGSLADAMDIYISDKGEEKDETDM